MALTSTKRLACLAIACAFLLAAGCGKEPRAATKPQTDEQVLQHMMADISAGIESLGRDIETTAKTISATGLSGDLTRTALARLCAEHQSSMIDCSTIDAKGVITTMEPAAFRHLEGSDVSKHQVSIVIGQTKQPALSQLFRTVEKINAIVFEWPIFSKEGVWLGAISVCLRPDRFLAPIIENDTRPPVFSGWVTETDGDLLYSPDPNQTGRNVFTDPIYKHMKELRELGRKIVANRSGDGIFRRPSVGQGDALERRCLWDTIDLLNAQWRVILVKKI